MTKEARKRANAKYLGKMADIRLHVKKELKSDIKKAADKRNLSITAFIIQCVDSVLLDDWTEEITKNAHREKEQKTPEKPKGSRILLVSNEKLKEAGYNI